MLTAPEPAAGKAGVEPSPSLAGAHEPLRLPKKKGCKQVIKVKERHWQVRKIR